MTKAINDVIAERQRQIEKEGFDNKHDNQWRDEELAQAAAIYALSPQSREIKVEGGMISPLLLIERIWPWNFEWYKPTVNDRRKELVRAAALILAEIDRLDAIKKGEE